MPEVAARAASGASGAAQSAEERELSALDLMVRAGRAFDGRRFAEAGGLYRAAWVIDPANNQALVLAGVAAYEAGLYQPARRDLQQALARRLSPDDRALARSYLDLLAARPRAGSADATATAAAADDTTVSASATAAGVAPAAASVASDAPEDPAWTPTVSTAAGAGYDSNVRPSSRALDTDILPAGPAAAPFLSATLDLGISRPLGRAADIDLRYSVDQKAQLDRALADFDSLEHEAAVELTERLGRLARLSLAATGTLSFTGLPTGLRPFSSSIRVDPQIHLGRDPVRLRLGLAWQRITTQDAAFAHLSGRRLEVSATPVVTAAGWQLWLTGRLRQDLLGTARTPLPPQDDPTCPGCLRTLVEPYSNLSTAASLRLAAPLRWRLRPSLAARWERRLYDLPRRTELASPAGELSSGAQLRTDHLLSAAAGVQLRLAASVVAGARFEESAFVVEFAPFGRAACTSTICPMDPRADSVRRRRAIALEITLHWL